MQLKLKTPPIIALNSSKESQRNSLNIQVMSQEAGLVL